MSKDKINNDESQSKGGRYPKYNAEYFTMKGNRPDELAILKMQYGSEGIDFYVSVFETLCESDYFVYHFQNKYKLELLAKKKEIQKERFLEILKFCVEEMELFNQELYQKGYIFSGSFLNSFDSAGLFRNRSMSADDVRDKVNELLGKNNQRLSEANSNSGSVEASIVKDSIADNSEEKKEDSIEKKRISKGEVNLNKSKEPINDKGNTEENNSAAPIDYEEPIF